MSLDTPLKIRMLQRKLYQKAKEEPNSGRSKISWGEVPGPGLGSA